MPNTTANPIIKPSDAVSWGSCARRVWLDNCGYLVDLSEGEPTKDAFEQLVIELGLAHEKTVFDRLSEEPNVHTTNSPKHTKQLMTEGVNVIHQAQLIDNENDFVGYPDF